MTTAPPATIGLTGGIGSGKSTVAAELAALGAAIVDTDAIAHALTAAGGGAMASLRAAFGDAVAGADGALDRAFMRQRVFEDPQAKAQLEAILHPMISRESQRQAEAAAGAAPVVVFDVPLLAESAQRGGPGQWRRRCARILVVDCAAEVQLARVVARSGWSEEQVRRVIGQQASRAARRAIADAVICNNGAELPPLRAQVRTLWALWGLPLPAGDNGRQRRKSPVKQ